MKLKLGPPVGIRCSKQHCSIQMLYGYLVFVWVSFSNLLEATPVRLLKVFPVILEDDSLDLGAQVGIGLAAVR